MAWKMGIPLKSPKLVAHAVICEELDAGRLALRRIRHNVDPRSYERLYLKFGQWFEAAEIRLTEHLAPCSQLERFRCAFDWNEGQQDKSHGTAEVDRVPPARRRASEMGQRLLDRLADVLEAVENAPEDTELQDEVAAKREDLDNLLVCMANMLETKLQKAVDLIHGQGQSLSIVQANTDFLFHCAADEKLKSQWKKAIEKYGPRLFTAAIHAAASGL